MEHKQPKPRQKKVPGLEPCHYCGTCANKTESYEIEGVPKWDEHCLAGCSYEHMRHTVNCEKWERSQYA